MIMPIAEFVTYMKSTIWIFFTVESTVQTACVIGNAGGSVPNMCSTKVVSTQVKILLVNKRFISY